MTRYRARPRIVDAMAFDGTRTGATRLAEWVATLAPDAVVRPRLEYRGWNDQVGHLELEIRDVEAQCGSGDWVVISDDSGLPEVSVVDDRLFRSLFRPVQIDPATAVRPIRRDAPERGKDAG